MGSGEFFLVTMNIGSENIVLVIFFIKLSI